LISESSRTADVYTTYGFKATYFGLKIYAAKQGYSTWEGQLALPNSRQETRSEASPQTAQKHLGSI
jgi:hypothetical protein